MKKYDVVKKFCSQVDAFISISVILRHTVVTCSGNTQRVRRYSYVRKNINFSHRGRMIWVLAETKLVAFSVAALKKKLCG